MGMTSEERVAIEQLAFREVNLIAESAAAQEQTIEEALTGYLELKRMCIHHAKQRIAAEKRRAVE